MRFYTDIIASSAAPKKRGSAQNAKYAQQKNKAARKGDGLIFYFRAVFPRYPTKALRG